MTLHKIAQTLQIQLFVAQLKKMFCWLTTRSNDDTCDYILGLINFNDKYLLFIKIFNYIIARLINLCV